MYARYELYQSRNVRFYKIPDKILAHLGLNENSDPYNEENGEGWRLMELLPFQIEASAQIAERFHEYMEDPLTITRARLVPFYQNLSAITGSGKTLILADAIEQNPESFAGRADCPVAFKGQGRRLANI